MKNKEYYLSSTALVTAIGIAFSSHAALSSAPNEMESPIQDSVSSASIASQMPDNPLLSPQLNEKVRQSLKGVSNIKPDDLYNLVNNHIILDVRGQFRDSFGNERSIQYLIRNSEELASKILGNHSPETIDLFLYCVNLANAQKDAHNKANQNRKHFYPKDFMHVSHLDTLMKAVLKFPEDEQTLSQKYIGILSPLLGNHYDNTCVEYILKSLNKIPADNREAVVQETIELAELDPDPENIMDFLRILPKDDVPDAIKCLKKFDSQFPGCISFKGDSHPTLSKILSSSAQDKELLHDIINAFLTFPGMDSEKNNLSKNSRRRIFESFQEVKKVDIETLSNDILHLKEKVHQLVPFHDFHDLEDLFHLFYVLAPMKSEQRLAIIDDLDIIEGTEWEKKSKRVFLLDSENRKVADLFERLTQCKKHNPKYYREYLQEMLDKTNNKTLGARIAILGFLEEKLTAAENRRGVAPANNDDIGPIVRRLSRLFAYLLNDTAGFEDAELVIKKVNIINRAFTDLDEIIPFLELPLQIEEKNDLIDSLIELVVPHQRIEGEFTFVRLDDRADYMAQALRLYQLNIDNPDHSRILRSLAAADTFHERQELVNRIVALEKDVYTNEDILNILGYFPNLERHWFDRNHNQPLGTNVHEGDRDERVTQALHTLITYQGRVGTQELNKAIEGCKKYINESSITPEVKKKALNALFGPNSPNGWSSLWSQSVSKTFANLDGIALIGRLWKYADTFVDPQVPQETENARLSFVLACADCSDANDFTICNLGKVQRIVCGVLQGRLPNVVIDKAVVDQKDEKQEIPEQANGNVKNDNEVDNTPSGREIASLYLMTLQNQKLPRAEATILRNAFEWLRNQDIELEGQMRTEFVDDIKTFFEMMKD